MEPDELERLTGALDTASAAAVAAAAQAEAVRSELHEEKLWRRWVLAAVVVFAVAALAFGTYMTLSVQHEDTLLSRARVLQTENHEVLDTVQKALAEIEQATGPSAQARSSSAIQVIVREVVNDTDCRTRDDVADALHAVLPSVAVTMPATQTCASYTAG